jgi:transcriptional regulator
MYTPRHFAETRLEVLHQTIRENPFASLVSHGAGGLVATHLPFLLDPERGELGTLRAHMARANPQWRDFSSDEVLVVFEGPHAYISPSWYAADLAVPTWNYLAVHAYGTPALLTDEAEALALLSDQVSHFESPFEQPWSAATLPSTYLDPLVKAIVAFEIPITRLEGKAKMSQNRAQDQIRVAGKLESFGDPTSLAVAREIRAHLATPVVRTGPAEHGSSLE